MKESYIEVLARYDGPESCVDDPRGRGKPLTGESIGRIIELRNHQFPEGIPSGLQGTRNGMLRYCKRHSALAESKNLGMCGRSPRGPKATRSEAGACDSNEAKRNGNRQIICEANRASGTVHREISGRSLVQ